MAQRNFLMRILSLNEMTQKPFTLFSLESLFRLLAAPRRVKQEERGKTQENQAGGR
jgi:hypothetical protein